MRASPHSILAGEKNQLVAICNQLIFFTSQETGLREAQRGAERCRLPVAGV